MSGGGFREGRGDFIAMVSKARIMGTFYSYVKKAVKTNSFRYVCWNIEGVQHRPDDGDFLNYVVTFDANMRLSWLPHASWCYAYIGWPFSAKKERS